jgi:hypothetical protein
MESRYYEDLNYALYKADIDRLEQIWNESFEKGVEGLIARTSILKQLNELAEKHSLNEPKTFLELLNAYNKKTVLMLLEKGEYREALKRIVSSREPVIYVLRWLKQNKPPVLLYFYGELLYALLHQTKDIEFLTLFPQKYFDYTSKEPTNEANIRSRYNTIKRVIFESMYKYEDRELFRFVSALPKEVRNPFEPDISHVKEMFEFDDFIIEGSELLMESDFDKFKERFNIFVDGLDAKHKNLGRKALEKIAPKFVSNERILNFLITMGVRLEETFELTVEIGSDKEVMDFLAYTEKNGISFPARKDVLVEAVFQKRWNIVTLLLPSVLNDLQNMDSSTIKELLQSPNQNDVNIVVRTLRDSRYHNFIMHEDI